MKGHALRCLLLALAVAAAFGPSLKMTFFMDDYLHLSLVCDPEIELKDFGFNSFSTAKIPDTVIRDAVPWWGDPGFQFNYFRPSPTLSMALDCALWGDNPFGYHLSSVLLHIVCAWVLYGLCLALGLRPWFALLAGLAATLHFNHLFPVSWMCARDNTLGTIFMGLTLWLLHTYLKREGDDGGRGHLLALAFMTYFCGILSKESMVLSPFLLLVLAFVRLGGLKAIREDHSRIRAYLPLVPFFTFSLLYVMWYAWSGHGTSTGYVLASPDKTLVENLSIMGRNLYLYLAAITFFLPPDLHTQSPLITTWPTPLFLLLPTAMWVALVVWKRSLFRSLPVLWLFLVWIFLFLFTPLWFIPRAGFLYKSTVGFCLFATGFLQVLTSGMASRRWKKTLLIAFTCFFVILPLFLDSAGTALLARQGDKIHLELDRAVTKILEAHPEGSVVFLLNAPNPSSVYLANVVYRYHHKDKETRIYTLSNAKEIPSVLSTERNGFCLHNPNGLLVLNVPFPKIPFREGQMTPMPGFRVEQVRVEDGVPQEVCITLERPLDAPEHIFVTFQDGEPERFRFRGPGKEGNAE